MTYRVRHAEEANEQIRSLSPKPRRAIRRAIRDLYGGPSVGDTKQLRGGGALWRARVGRWRAIFRLDQDARRITILRVGPRETVYDDLESLRR